MLGLSQCGNYTAGIKALAGLFPAATRSRAGGFFNAGAQFGSVIAPPIVVFLASQFGWRMAFVIPALIGLCGSSRGSPRFPTSRRWGPSRSSRRAPLRRQPAGLTLGELIANHKVLGLFLIRVFTGPITTFY